MAPTIYRKEVLVKGHPTMIRCIDIGDHVFTISDGFPRIVTIADEWYECLERPQEVVECLRVLSTVQTDILTFWNPLPESVPRHEYPSEAEEIAVLPIASYDDWWQHRIKSRTRNLIRKSEKQGIDVRVTQFDDEFCRGVSAIFNETPVRQGRRFWHYGKDPETVRRQFSRFIHRETMIGAYVGGEMIGFIMLGNAGRCAHLGQIISKVSERDRNTNSVLMAKAVEVCARQGNECLVYGSWSDSSLTEFKRRCGFEAVSIPHYFVPVSMRGAMTLRVGAHRGMRNLIPPRLQNRLRQWRTLAYSIRRT